MTKDEQLYRLRAASLRVSIDEIATVLSFRSAGIIDASASKWMLDEIQKVIDDAFEKEKAAIAKWQKGE